MPSDSEVIEVLLKLSACHNSFGFGKIILTGQFGEVQSDCRIDNLTLFNCPGTLRL